VELNNMTGATNTKLYRYVRWMAEVAAGDRITFFVDAEFETPGNGTQVVRSRPTP